MKKHSFSWVMIAKNEAHNIPRIYESIKGTYDKWILCDTGSTDDTVKISEKFGANVVHFAWINDFAAARNHAASFVETDYWGWLDLDDSLGDKENFLAWKDNVMHMAEAWFAPYNYAFTKDGQVACSFIRERIFKTSCGLRFHDPVHEGVLPIKKDGGPAQTSVVNSWRVNHQRTQEEIEGDKGRNLKILEDRKDSLSPRLLFYLGKELFDAGRPSDAHPVLAKSLENELQPHDKILAIQYLCHALFQCQKYQEVIGRALAGLGIDPNRAEFHCVIADSYIALNQVHNAVPYYNAAKNCHNQGGGGLHGTFTLSDCYGYYPRFQLAKIYMNAGLFQKAKDELFGLDTVEAKEVLAQAENVLVRVNTFNSSVANECGDIVITCPPEGAYAWDEAGYKTKGYGGSETAAIEMSIWLKRLTGRSVKIFQPRENVYASENGVEYYPVQMVHDYFSKNKPKLHIMWRHSAKLTSAPSYVWCHDLITPGAENHQNHSGVITLSEFHRNFVKGVQGIPNEKLIVSRNGVNPERFKDIQINKDPHKLIWSSSPDRGLDDAIRVLDKVREKLPLINLHVYYGMDNMYKYGLGEKADMIKKMISERPWITYHGNVDQKTLAESFASASVWLYNTWFQETFCITALESLLMKCFPIVRNIGALPNTLGMAKSLGMAEVLDYDINAVDSWADAVYNALNERKWERIDIKPDQLSWESVASEWVDLFNLKGE